MDVRCLPSYLFVTQLIKYYARYVQEMLNDARYPPEMMTHVELIPHKVELPNIYNNIIYRYIIITSSNF